MRSKTRQRSRGFSFLEVLTTCAVVGLITTFALPQLDELRRPWILRSTVRQIAADFELTRMRAIARNQRHRITYSVEAREYIIARETSPGSWSTETRRPVHAIVTVPSAFAAGSLIFDSRGMANSNLSVPLSVPYNGATHTGTVSINVLGRTTIS